jgi:hypothetical protein
MRVIERSEYRTENGEIGLENRIRGTIDHGLSWYGEMEAQTQIVRRLDKTLGNEHTIICNLPLRGKDLVIPLILISPQGVRVIVPSSAKGIFRAKVDEWQKFDGRSRSFKKSKPNLQMIALSMSSSVQHHLEAQNLPLPEVESVMMFSNPRTHVDTLRPSTRVVLADAIDHFAGNLQGQQVILNGEDMALISEALLNPGGQAEQVDAGFVESPRAVDAQELLGDDTGYGARALSPRTPRPIRRTYGFGSFRLEAKQWIVLGILLFFEIIVLTALIMVVLANTLYA